LVDNHSYLQAWCRHADAVRLFRFDRIDEATELDERAMPPEEATAAGTALELFSDDPSLPLARLKIAADHAWLLDQYPMNPLAVNEDGTIEATMRFATFEWMARLLLGFGTGVAVLEPIELVDSLRRRSVAALSAYQEMESAL
jgi:proteasome accessory factor C